MEVPRRRLGMAALRHYQRQPKLRRPPRRDQRLAGTSDAARPAEAFDDGRAEVAILADLLFMVMLLYM